MENQLENGLTRQKFTWTIKEFTKLKMDNLYSDYFLLGGYIWYLSNAFVFNIVFFIVFPSCFWGLSNGLHSRTLTGVLHYAPRRMARTICLCIWMFRVLQIIHSGGVEM